MVTFTQIPDNNTPLGGAVVYAFACDTPQTVDLRVTEAESGTLLGVRRFVEASAAKCDIAPMLRRALRFTPATGSTGVRPATERQVTACVELRAEAAEEVLATAPDRTFPGCRTAPAGPMILTTMPENRLIAPDESDELLLKLNDTRELWDRWSPKKGDTIAVEDGAAKTGKMFVESVVPESGLITLRAYSAPQSTKDKRSKSWEKVKFLQLIQEIAGRHGLTVETYGITDQTYDYVEQNNLPDFAFLQARCTLEGAAFLVYDGKLVVYDEAYMEGQQPVDTITITPANDFEYRDEGAYAYGSAEAVNGGLTGTFSAPAGGDKVLRKILPFRMTDQAEADRFAKGLLRDANQEATVATLWTGTLLREYAAGSVVTLSTEGVASWDGTAFVSRIRHDYVKTRSKLYLRKPLEGY